LGSDLDQYLGDIVRGDSDAFGHWIAAAEPALRRSLVRYRASVDVEIVVQETLLRVWQLAPRVQADGQPNCLLRWASRCAKNLALDELRRSRRFVPSDEVAEIELAEPAIEADVLLRERIADCQRRLPEKPGLALQARIDSAGGAPDETLAGMLSMKLNTFHQNLARARKLLAECLRRAGIEWGFDAETGRTP